MGVAGNILIAGTMHCIVPVYVCLQILNSFNMSGMDGATLFKFVKWVKYGRFQTRGEKFPLKGAWSGSCDPFKNFNPSNISGMEEATLFKFGKWIDYGKSHSKVKNFPRKWHGLGHVAPFKMLNPLQYFWNG